MQDRNFDGIAEKFSQNIYGTSKGRLRQAILWQELDALLATLPPGPLRVLDAGCGEGQTGCGIAALGHRVLLCDVSSDMLQRAQALAAAKGVSGNVQFKQIAVQEVGQHLDTPVDLVLFHAVLEWVAEPEQVLQALWNTLAPGGILSLMFYNSLHAVMRSMVLGYFDYVNAGLPPPRRKSKITPTWPRDPSQVYQWLTSLGFEIERKAGIRVFRDYLHDKAKPDQDFAGLLQAESRYCRQEPWIQLGRYIHVTARKPIQKEVL
ncbi:tRNA uridine 5-oxyacetic acid(34) methyltransferase CmoM [Pantoea sp. 1.19]|uniref:tRNA uridine 5-oxyacetic acid(34) methyltransferase CmoM n=1 Tax=Pantoea sp. 1.19 TaxID=1925589 RepID=UPI000948F0C3|nr:tRNA uridine 5-oxyacetic acid(34) methyltransferase CmoM [Pantoea sp. 1.19]